LLPYTLSPHQGRIARVLGGGGCGWLGGFLLGSPAGIMGYPHGYPDRVTVMELTF